MHSNRTVWIQHSLGQNEINRRWRGYFSDSCRTTHQMGTMLGQIGNSLFGHVNMVVLFWLVRWSHVCFCILIVRRVFSIVCWIACSCILIVGRVFSFDVTCARFSQIWILSSNRKGLIMLRQAASAPAVLQQLTPTQMEFRDFTMNGTPLPGMHIPVCCYCGRQRPRDHNWVMFFDPNFTVDRTHWSCRGCWQFVRPHVPLPDRWFSQSLCTMVRLTNWLLQVSPNHWMLVHRKFSQECKSCLTANVQHFVHYKRFVHSPTCTQKAFRCLLHFAHRLSSTMLVPKALWVTSWALFCGAWPLHRMSCFVCISFWCAILIIGIFLFSELFPTCWAHVETKTIVFGSLSNRCPGPWPSGPLLFWLVRWSHVCFCILIVRWVFSIVCWIACSCILIQASCSCILIVGRVFSFDVTCARFSQIWRLLWN